LRLIEHIKMKVIVLLLLGLALASCGSGGSGITGNTPAEQEETASASEEQPAEEQATEEDLEGPEVISATLFDVSTNAILADDIQEGDAISIPAGASLAIQFIVPDSCDSIRMRINGSNVRNEESAPFCSGGDNGACLADSVLSALTGQVEVDAQCFSEPQQSGTAGALFSRQITFNQTESWAVTQAIANPSSSSSIPLSDVSLSCSADGNASGDISWSYRCDENDDWVFGPTLADPGLGTHNHNFSQVCSYSNAGSYAPACRSQRAGIDAFLGTSVTVTNNPPPAVGSGCDCGALVCSGNSASYTRDGHTIGFEFNCEGGACACGKFANNKDYWVAPLSAGQTISITQMTPAQSGSGSTLRNGAELNPSDESLQGFNGHRGPDTSQRKFPIYSADLTLGLPYHYDSSMETEPDVIVKTESPTDDFCANNSVRICIQYAETLTLLPSAPTQLVFRPPYFGDDKPALIPASSFDDSILSSVPSVSSSPSWQYALDATQSVHLEHTRNWNTRQGMHSYINHAKRGKGYESAVAYTSSVALLKMNEAATTGAEQEMKRQIALSVAQLGIDLYSIHRSDTPCFTGWPATGGFGGGKLGPIIFAANLLGQDTWLDNINVAMGGNTSGDTVDRNCFAELGFVRPAIGIGKDIPLFGMRPSSYAGTSCKSGTNQNCASGYGDGSYTALTDGDLTGSSGSPTAYQVCCTHGYMLAQAMAFWLSPETIDNMPTPVESFLVYIERARNLGVENGSEFGTYNNPSNFNSAGYDANYDSSYLYEMWNTYKECADARNCTGFAN
jgi:hypothetical protein